MANSSLATYNNTGHSKYDTRNNTPITKIIIHQSSGKDDLRSLSAAIANYNTSWNYGIDSNGQIGLYVPEQYAARSCSNSKIDKTAISIILCNSSLGPKWQVSKSALDSLQALMYDICVRNTITKLNYSPIIDATDVVLHRWIDNTICPGPYIEGKLPEIITSINKKLQTRATNQAKANQVELFSIQAEVDSSAGLGLTEWIDVTGKPIDALYDYKIVGNRAAIHPYIATIDGSVSVDYGRLISAGVIGVLLDGAALFDTDHQVTTRFYPGWLGPAAAQASNAGLPFGIVMHTRAKDLFEARSEMNLLYQLVSKYPPGLGVWLRPQGTASALKDRNAIISAYHDILDRWKLADKCGIYATKEELSRISWKMFKPYFLLNIISPISDVGILDTILPDTFFQV